MDKPNNSFFLVKILPLINSIIVLLFFVTGFCSLTYQVAWNKILNQTVGTDYVSVTLVVSIFMLGLGLGSYLGSLLTKKKNFIYFYFCAEIIVAIYGLLSNHILRSIPALSSFLVEGVGFRSFALDLLLNAIALSLPTLMMGISLPIVIQFFRNYFPGGAAVGFLYSVNVIGAACGAYISGIFIIAALGVTQTITLASILLMAMVVIVGGFFFFFEKNHRTYPELEPSPAQVQDPETIHGKRIYIISFLIGFIALAYEILYFRFFVSFFNASSYVFPTLLASYLIQICIGNYWAARQIVKGKVPEAIGKIVSFASLSTLFILFAPSIMARFQPMDRYLFNTSNGYGPLITSLIISLILFTPIAFISAFFPLFVHRLTLHQEDIGQNVGKLYLVQTSGNFFGCVLTGFVFIPLVGTVLYLKVLACLLIFVGGYYFIREYGMKTLKPLRNAILVALSLLIFSITIITINENFIFKNFTYESSPTRIIDDFEGIGLLYDIPDRTRIVIGAETATSYHVIDQKIPAWPMMDVAGSIMGIENRKPRVLIIGIGPAIHAAVIKKMFPDAEIVVVELVDLVINEMQSRGAPYVKDLLKNSKIIVTDGRRFINKSDDKFDFIQIGVFQVTGSGAGNLFTKEFLKKVGSLLAPNGVLTFNAYLPAVKVGMEIFPNVFIASRGENEVSDVFFWNRSPKIKSDNLIAIYPRNRKYYVNLFKNDPLVNTTLTGREFFIFDKTDIQTWLRGISPQLDDLVATEYYLTKKISWEGEHDSRIWKRTPSSVLVKSLVY